MTWLGEAPNFRYGMWEKTRGMETMTELAGRPLKAILADANLSREKRASLQVYTVLRRAIISVQLEPNRPISEQDVATLLAVSRTPVREAFIRLSEEGLLTTYPQLASVIAPIRMDALLEAQFIREAVECATAERAARVIDEDGILRLRSVLERHRAALEAERWAEFHALDEETHRMICVAAGLSGLVRTLEQARGHLDRVRYLTLPDVETSRRVVAQHEAVIDAIGARRPDEARDAMRTHIRDILGSLPGLRERQPDYFEEKPQFGRRVAMRS